MESPSVKSGRLRAALRILLVVVFVDLAGLLLVLFAHALLSAAVLVTVAEALFVPLVFLSVASILVGTSYAWASFPQHRRAILFVVAITLVTLLAHAYIMGAPPASSGATVSGQPGVTFSDSKLTVGSTVAGSVLTLSVDATGGDAIANVTVSGNGQPLSGPGFSSPPSFSDPLQPGQSVAGDWNLPASGNLTSLNVSYQYLTCYSTSSKAYGCIMDEVFYVPEAMGILSGQHCSTTASECHMEHPYLVPALVAGGMAVFGEYNAASWRVMPALLGSFSLPLLFGVAWKVSGNKRIAYLSTILLALDVMFFSQSSGALLDIPETFFGISAFFAYFVGLRVWKLDKYVISGILLGVAGLAKETAIFFALGFLTYLICFDPETRRKRVYASMKVALALVIVFAIGLQAYDSTLATPAVPTFVQHVEYILSYGSSLIAKQLACQPTTGYWCKFANDPGGPPILPTDWILFYSPVAYYATSVSVCPNSVNGTCKGGQYTYVGLAYYGVTNLLETWTVFIWVPLAAFVVYNQLRKRQPSLDQYGFEGTAEATPGVTGDSKFAALALVWFLWNYLPYIALFVDGRVTYPFYFVPAIPAVAMGATYWLTRDWFPKWLVWVYVAIVFVFFFVYFPEKGFLPDWLRVIIGH